MTSGKKKVVIGFILVFLIMLACLTIFRYIFIKSHIVHFNNAQVELVVRQELRRIGNASYDKNIMTLDVDKITKLGFIEFDEIVPLPEDISDLKKLKNLERLSIHSLNSKTKNLNILAELPNLKKLNINKMVKQNDQGEWIEIPIVNLNFLSGALSLENLVVSFKGEDISPLKDMKTLKHLDIWGGELKDISILASLSNLETFEARNNNISDITPLMRLEHLVYAGLKDNPVAKDESYKELWKILNERREKKGLEIMSNEDVGMVLIILTSILSYKSYFKPMNENTVTFDNKQIEKLVRNELGYRGNEKLTNEDLDKVSHLNFKDEFGEITPSPEDLSELKKLKNLKKLTIQSLNSKTDLNTLKELPNLTFLSIYKMVKENDQGEWEQTPLSNVDFLSGAPMLKQIIMKDCGLKNISGLKDMTTLSFLYIEYNQVEDISVLATLSNLNELRASDNKIEDISALRDLKNLNYANLTDNPVAEDKLYIELWMVLNKRRVKDGLDEINVGELY